MALGNYTTLAFAPDGKTHSGHYTSPLGVEVVTYKNWLYVHDERAWHEGVTFARPTIMQIEYSTTITYKDTHIATFWSTYFSTQAFAVWSSPWSTPDNIPMGMAGVSAYAYSGDEDHLIDERQLDLLRTLLKENHLTGMFPFPLGTIGQFNQGVAYLSKHIEEIMKEKHDE